MQKNTGNSLLNKIIHAKNRSDFTVNLQLEFIDLLESFSGMKKQDRLRRLSEVYRTQSGKNSVELKVCEDLMRFSSQGRYEKGLERWFDKRVLFMYRVASYSKKRGDVVDIIMRDLKEEKSLVMDSFVVKLIKPLVIIGVSLAGILLEYNVIIPVFAKMFEIENPYTIVSTSVLYIGRFFTDFGILFAISMIALRVVFVKIRDNWVGDKRDAMSEHFPLIIFRSFQAAKLLKVISLMKDSDMKLLDILRKIDTWVDPYLKWHVRKMIKGLVQGKPKSTFFGVGLLNGKQKIRLAAQQENASDKFSEALMVLATHAQKDAALTVIKISANLVKALFIICIIFAMTFMEGFAGLLLLMEI